MNQLITQQPSSVPTPVQQKQIERKYGMFLHFGINTFHGVEWSDGTLPPLSYAPPVIHAEQWVKTAYDAGMNQVILICKHHDGFCMWHTRYTDYGVSHSSNPADVVAEVSKACRKYGVKLGLYYSLWDRHEPCYSDTRAYIEYMKNQLTELLDGRYGPVVELWLDGGWDKPNPEWGLDELYDLVKRLQPDCAFGVNNTLGVESAHEMSSERYLPERCVGGEPMRYFPSDFRLRDPFFPRPEADGDPKIYTYEGQEYYLPFEATICVRNMNNWFWDAGYTKDPTVTPAFIAEKYRQLIAQNNILVVNCAPNPWGKLEEYDRQTIFEAARMLGIARGEAVLAEDCCSDGIEGKSD